MIWVIFLGGVCLISVALISFRISNNISDAEKILLDREETDEK